MPVVICHITGLPQRSAMEVFFMAFFMGCDVCKAKIDVALIDAQGSVLWEASVANDATALAVFLLTVSGAYPGEEIIGVVEATGRYHYPLVETGIAVAFPVKVYNPILTKQGIRSSVRGKKTDKTDAILIARMGARGEGRYYTTEPYRATKLQTRSYQKLGEIRQSLRRHQNHVSAMSSEVMTDTITNAFQAVEDALREAQEAVYRDMLNSVDGELFTRLQTIPGIGPYVASTIIGEVQDMVRFTRQKALTAYFGLDPKIRQSGHSLNSTGRLSKRGSPHGRRAIFIAANVARRFDPHCKAYYEKKRSEGKSYTVATCAVARKLLTIVRAVWLSGERYDGTLWHV